MFSLYGASRDNDRRCARIGDCEYIGYILQLGAQVEYVISTAQLSIKFNYAISGTSGYTAGKPPTWTSTHGRLRYTRGDASLEKWSYPAVNRWQCPFVPLLVGSRNTGRLLTPSLAAA